MSFYEVLEVPTTATIDEIKKSYRKLSLKYHPDRNLGQPEMVAKFQQIGEAYEVLGDEQKKEEYDMMQNSPFGKGRGGGIDELFSSLFGMNFGGQQQQQGHPFAHMMGPMGPMGGHPMGGPMGPMGGISINGMPFGGGPGIRIFRGGPPVYQKPAPIIKNIVITMAHVLDGAIIPVEIERWILENETKMFENETIYVTIPKGVDDNEIILLQNKGNYVSDVCIGDLKLFIKVENKSEFERVGLDLLCHKTITLKESLCGFSFELPYLNDKTFTINNTGGNIIPPEYKKIIPKLGLTRDDRTGSLIIMFHIQFPEKLTEEQLNKLNAIL
jgi:DnaJ-class molecular chaperone